MSEERSQFAQRIDEHQFTQSRKGYDKREVKAYLQDLEQAFRELEGHARRTAQRVGDLERDLSKARDTEKVSVDNAMMAVFDAKDRILERARRRAEEIEEEALTQATRIRETAVSDAGAADSAGMGEIAAARAQAEEIVAAARRDADRLRNEATGDETADLQSEILELTTQLRRAHEDTANARTDLDAARKRIVQLEGAGDARPDVKLDELEKLAESSRAELAELGQRLEEEQQRTESQQLTIEALETERDGHMLRLADLEAELAGVAAGAGEPHPDGERLAELEKELEQARHRVGELETALEAGRLVGPKEEAITEIELARTELAAARLAAATTEQARNELEGRLNRTLASLEESESKLAEMATHAERLRGELEVARASDGKFGEQVAVADSSDAAAFANRMRVFQDGVAASDRAEGELALTRELGRSTSSMATSTSGGAPIEIEDVLEAARREAESIKAEIEDEAEQRAAKVIAKAREEADQVRQTVATLTAQAEDARSAALRSKLEAEDLAEAQRSMKGAGDDILVAARAEAEEILRSARAEADQIRRESEEAARVRIGAAEERAADIVAGAQQEMAKTHTEDELDELLAEAEQEVALSEELRRQRQELAVREAEIAERERVLAEQQTEAALLLASDRRADGNETAEDSADSVPVSAVAPPRPPPPPGPSSALVADRDEEVAEGDDDDPAERLSDLLEQAAVRPPPPTEPVQARRVEPVRESSTPDDEHRPRFAWPTPADPDAEDEPSGERESRYRSRSAQLPRIGNQAKSSMDIMGNLRKKSRGVNN